MRLAPFSYLFVKHVGNVYNRFVLTESACEQLIDKFFELKEHSCHCGEFIFVHKLGFYPKRTL